MRTLIITADDFGYDDDRNRGIVECFMKGAITRTSLLVNGIACPTAFQLAKKYSIPIGLHLNLTEGKPLCLPEQVPTLLTCSESFHGKFGLRNAVSNGLINMEEVAKEISAQIDTFRKLNDGDLPVYVDGHQHVHILPNIRDVFAKILSQYGITNTRLPLESGLSECSWLSDAEMDFFRSVIKLSKEAKHCFMHYGLIFADNFVGLSTMGSHMSCDRLKQLLCRCSSDCKSFELMVHPGYRCRGVGGCGPEGADDFARSIDREHELGVLTSDILLEFYVQKQFLLTDRVL